LKAPEPNSADVRERPGRKKDTTAARSLEQYRGEGVQSGREFGRFQRRRERTPLLKSQSLDVNLESGKRKRGGEGGACER